MKTTYNNGKREGPPCPESIEVMAMLEDIQQRQVRIETRICVLATAMGHGSHIQTTTKEKYHEKARI